MLKIFNYVKNIGLSSFIILLVLLTAVITVFMVIQTPKQQFAFPSAEGFGAYVTGGRGGIVYHVKTLKDTNEVGSLRYAINQTGARTIVFDVSGTIHLKSPLIIKSNDLTIAGQTSKGGINISDYPMILEADNIIIRFLRFYGSETKENSSLVAYNRQNIIIDHCSFVKNPISNIELYNNRNLSLQWCIIANSKYKGATLGGYSSSYHHNLFANNDFGNPNLNKSIHNDIKGLETVDFRNNVIYNWKDSSIENADSGSYNFVNNYYIYGNKTLIKSRTQIVEVNNKQRKDYVYVNGNYIYENPLQTNDNWMGVFPNMNYIKTSKNPQLTRFEYYHEPITNHTAKRAYKNIIEFAGVSHNNDLTDSSIIKDIQAKNKELITNTNRIEDIEIKFETDSDSDGIPDDWESKNNLNPYDAGDGKTISNNGYTNLEIYLNSLVENITTKQNKSPSFDFDNYKLLIQKISNYFKS